MKLLAFNAYYVPEVLGSIRLSEELYSDLARNGIKVELYVPIPTRGINSETRKLYKTKKLETTENGNLVIHRVWLPVERKGLVLRALRYLLQNIVFIYKSLFVKADVIFVRSAPPTQGAMAAIIKKIKHIPFVYNLQDIFPDSIVSTGLIRRTSLVYRLGRILENFTYRHADNIIVISDDMKRNIMKKGVPEYKISVISNWVDTKNVCHIHRDENHLFDKFNISRDKFTVVYAGNLGHAQNIEVILNSAKKLRDFSDIQFLIFGKGSQEEEYKAIAKKMQLINVQFFPLQPYSEVSNVYSMADLSIVSCKPGFGGIAMPSKTWSILATGTPIIACFDNESELRSIIEKFNLGYFADAGNVYDVSDIILEAFRQRDSLKIKSANARRYAEKNASRNICTNQYAEIIKKCNSINV